MTESRCLLYQPGHPARAISLDAVSDHVNQDNCLIWLELDGAQAGTIAKLGEELGLHELALEDAYTTHQRPKLEEYESHVFISVKTAELWEQRVHFGEMHFFVGSNFIASIRHGRGLNMQRALERMQLMAENNNHATTSALALYLILDLVTDHYRPVLDSMGDRFFSLENTLLSDTLDRHDLERLYNVKRELSMLREAVEPMQGIVQDLIRLHPKLVIPSLKVYYRDVHDHAMRHTVAIDKLRGHASDAMQFHLATLTLKQNESVQKLAGWGAILAIPTVIFSLYGMNFDWMPELHLPWMYPLVLGATFSGSVWLYRRLKSRNWI